MSEFTRHICAKNSRLDVELKSRSVLSDFPNNQDPSKHDKPGAELPRWCVRYSFIFQANDPLIRGTLCSNFSAVSRLRHPISAFIDQKYYVSISYRVFIL